MSAYAITGYFRVTDEAKLLAAAAKYGDHGGDVSLAISFLLDPSNISGGNEGAWGIIDLGTSCGPVADDDASAQRFLDAAQLFLDAAK